MGQSKEPIRLRQRKTPAGLISLYLDIYLNGQRSYEYLKLYLIQEQKKTPCRAYSRKITGELSSLPFCVRTSTTPAT